jgi:hypothetical protein
MQEIISVRRETNDVRPTCDGLIMKCPPQPHVLNTWSPAGGTILGGSGNFRKWGLGDET